MATSGLMVMARGPDIQRALSKLFETREVYKRYAAVVDGRLNSLKNESSFTSTSTLPSTSLSTPENFDGWQLIDLPIAVDWPRRPLRIIDRTEGKPSQTRWRALAFMADSNSTHVELEPLTGRSHQLRVHLQALGHSIWEMRFMRLKKLKQGPTDFYCTPACWRLHTRSTASTYALKALLLFNQSIFTSNTTVLAVEGFSRRGARTVQR